MKEKKHQERYRKIKFIERQKLTRKQMSATTSLESATKKKDKQKFQAEIDEINAKLLYIEHFPRTQPYISILKSAEDMDEGSAKIRTEVFSSIKKEQSGKVSKYVLGSAENKKGKDSIGSTEGHQTAEKVLEADSFFSKSMSSSSKQISGSNATAVDTASDAKERFTPVEDEILREGAIHRKTKANSEAKNDKKASKKSKKSKAVKDSTATVERPDLKRKGAIHRKKSVGNEAGKSRAIKAKKI